MRFYRFAPRSTLYGLVVLGLLCGVHDDSLAAPTKSDRIIARMMLNPLHQRAVVDAAKRSPAWLHNQCPQAFFTLLPKFVLHIEPQFDEHARPLAGEWAESVLMTGCGAPRKFNVLVTVSKPSVLTLRPLVPGETITAPDIQKKASRFTLEQANERQSTECKSGYISDTHFVDPGREQLLHTPFSTMSWREAWDVNFCGRTASIMIYFSPDGNDVKLSPGQDDR